MEMRGLFCVHSSLRIVWHFRIPSDYVAYMFGGKQKEVIDKFILLELPSDEPGELFDILDSDKTGELGISEFVAGASLAFGFRTYCCRRTDSVPVK